MKNRAVQTNSLNMTTYILSLIAILLWGMSYLWSDRLLELGIPVEYFVFLRVLIAGLTLLVFNLILGKNIKIDRTDLKKFIPLAMFEPLIYFICETHGIRLTESPTFSALIIAAAPILSVFAGVMIFKEKFGWINMLGILICLGGIVMVTLCSESLGEHFVLGLILLVIAIVSEAGHATLTKALSSKYEPQVIVMYQFLIGSLLLLPLFLTKGIENFDASTYISWEVFKPILALSIFCSSIAFALWANSIKQLGVAKSSIFLSMIPVTTALFGWILGEEILNPLQWAGIVIAALGVILTQYAVKRKKSKRLA